MKLSHPFSLRKVPMRSWSSLILYSLCWWKIYSQRFSASLGDFSIPWEATQNIQKNVVGHIHLNKLLLQGLNISMQEALQKCEETMKKNNVDFFFFFKKIILSFRECCSFQHSCQSKGSDMPSVQKIGWVRYDSTESYLPRSGPRWVWYQIPRLRLNRLDSNELTDIPS